MNQSVTELDGTTGKLVRVVTKASGSDAITADRTQVWVANYFGQSVTSFLVDR